MATIRARNDAAAVAQVNTVTVGGTAASTQVYSVTINGKVVSYTAGVSDTNTTIASSLLANLIGSLIAEFNEVTWTLNALVITGTALVPGKPFTNTSAATGTGTLVTAITTVNSGPLSASTLANYSTGALPTGSDTLIFEGPASFLYDLTALAAAAPIVIFMPSHTGAIGLPDYTASGYFEYRQKYMQLASTSITSRSQSGRIKLDLASTASVNISIYNAGTPLVGDPFAVNIIKTGASSILNVQKGIVGLAMGASEVATFATVNVGSLNAPATDANVTLGPGVTWTTINQNGGVVTALASGTTWNLPAGPGMGILQGTTTLTTLNANSPTSKFFWQSTGTIGAANLYPKATLDSSQVPLARTLTNGTFQTGCTVNDPSATISFTNPFLLSGCGLEDVTLNLGKNRHWQAS